MIIKSSLFDKIPNLIFGFSTKKIFSDELINSTNWSLTDIKHANNIFLKNLNLDHNNISYLRKIHSAYTFLVEKPGLQGEGDAMFTQIPNLFLQIHVADCVPIFFYSKKGDSRIIASAHSGRRGSQQNIVGNVLKKFKDICHDITQTLVYIGPSIHHQNYEFGEIASSLFEEKYVKNNDGKICLDVKAIVYDQLISQGVLSQNIEVSPLCTYSDQDLLFSYRREKGTDKRMFGVIGLL